MPDRQYPRHHRRKKALLIPVLMFAVLFIGTSPGMAKEKTSVSNIPSEKRGGPIRATQKSIADTVRVLLTAAQETTLSSRISGVITDIHVTLGEAFSEKKVLVTLDSREHAARLAMAEADLSASREQYEAKLRMQGLQQASEVDVAVAASALSKSQAQVDLYRTVVSYCTIKAPFPGRVVRVAAKPYQSVEPGQPLLEIVSNGTLKLRLNLPAVWATRIKEGSLFEVTINWNEKRYKAKVTALNGRVDAVSQTLEVEGVMLKIHPELLPGMSGTADFNISE